MLHLLLGLYLLLPGDSHFQQANGIASPISIPYDVGREHELKPHRRTIPIEGVSAGFNQLRLTLLVSEMGDTIKAEASGGNAEMALWPAIQGEVERWRFAPFEKDGHPVKAEVEEYVDLVPPERLPTKHVVPPILKPNSVVKISLARSGCYGSCPAYLVSLENSRVSFDGRYFVVAAGKHTDAADPDEVRALAKRFIQADIYSMDDSYRASVTDSPTYSLTISIDGRIKTIEDYVGPWQGMPAIISDLEDQVDEVGETNRWIKGSDGLVDSLKAEGFNFHSIRAQEMLKSAAENGQSATVQEFIAVGVPLTPLSKPKQIDPSTFEGVGDGWLTSASSQRNVLNILIQSGASKGDQNDKDLALVGAARSGDVGAMRDLIAYGADPNADLSQLIVSESSAGMTMSGPGSGSILIYAAESGNPEVVREILKFHPQLEERGFGGKTAIFAAGDYRSSDKDGARVECVRLLIKAGANVNARDNNGNTPLHETFLTDVEEELLKSGANVNARNNDGETPIFTTVDNDAIPLLIKHGADLTIRNKKGETVIQAAESKGPLRQEALRQAVQAANH